jgi:hypothetical protein
LVINFLFYIHFDLARFRMEDHSSDGYRDYESAYAVADVALMNTLALSLSVGCLNSYSLERNRINANVCIELSYRK